MPFAPMIQERLPAIKALCKQLGIAHLWIFGSAAQGKWNPEASDLDFLVELSTVNDSACKHAVHVLPYFWNQLRFILFLSSLS